MVGSEHPQQRLEFPVGDRRVGQVHRMGAVVRVVALERRDVAISAPVDQEVPVRDDGRACDRFVLAVGRRDCRHGFQREPVRAEPGGSVQRDHG